MIYQESVMPLLRKKFRPDAFALPVRLPLLLTLVFSLLLNGCEDGVLYRNPRAVLGGDGRLYLLAEHLEIGSEPPSFSLLVSSDPLRKNWSAPSLLRGRPAALVATATGAALVFTDGVVTRIHLQEGVLQREVTYSASVSLLDAVAWEGGILGLGQGEGPSFQLYRFTDKGWTPFSAPCRLFGRVERPCLSLVAGRPAIFYIRPVSSVDDPALRDGSQLLGRMLTGETWQPLPEMALTEAMNTLFFLPAPDGVTLYQGGGGVFSASADASLSLWHLRGEAWQRGVPLSLASLSGTKGAYSVSLAVDQETMAGLLALGERLQFFQVKQGRAEEVKVLAGGESISPEGEFIAYLFFSCVLLAAGVVRIVLRRRRMASREVAPVTAPEPLLINTPQGALPFDAGAGGLASPLERAVALLIDSLIVMVLPFSYILAQRINLTRLAQDLHYLNGPVVGEILMEFQIVFLFTYIFYTILFEALTGATLGKRLLGLTVRGLEGGRPPLLRIVLRNLFRPIDHWALPLPGMPILFFPALLSMVFSRYHQRVGDRIGGTVVVRRIPVADRVLVLASASPRRQVILKEMGLLFQVMPSGVDESMPLSSSPEEAVMQVAQRKAESVGKRLSGGEIVLAADTIVVRDDRILGKPADREDARRMLTSLSGRGHRVITAVAIWDRKTGRRLSACDSTDILMRVLTEEEIDLYVQSGEPDDKAGAYALQGGAGKFIIGIKGSSSNVVGLPAELVHSLLEGLES